MTDDATVPVKVADLRVMIGMLFVAGMERTAQRMQGRYLEPKNLLAERLEAQS